MVFNPASSSLLPHLVGHDEVVPANAALWAAAVFVQILAAPAAGAVIVAVGVEAAFAVNAAPFLVSAVPTSCGKESI